jgi:hypothetical protein
LFDAIIATPGIGGRRALMAATGMSEERVAIARRKLLDAMRIENRGSEKRPVLHATETGPTSGGISG